MIILSSLSKVTTSATQFGAQEWLMYLGGEEEEGKSCNGALGFVTVGNPFHEKSEELSMEFFRTFLKLWNGACSSSSSQDSCILFLTLTGLRGFMRPKNLCKNMWCIKNPLLWRNYLGQDLIMIAHINFILLFLLLLSPCLLNAFYHGFYVLFFVLIDFHTILL